MDVSRGDAVGGGARHRVRDNELCGDVAMATGFVTFRIVVMGQRRSFGNGEV
jgi:hypothetical protein